MWLAGLAVLVLAAGGCEQKEAPQVAPQQKAAVEEPKAAMPEQKPEPPAADDKVEKPAAEPAAPPAPAEAVKPAPAPAEAAKPAPAPTEAVKPAAAGPAPPQTVVYKASYGLVTFAHQAHAGSLACSACHATDPPARIAIDKDKAHQMCKGCHQEQGAGPTQCNGCHRK
jgi:outer membrane biosynthesis protein TonB